jgi:hypothetical protein
MPESSPGTEVTADVKTETPEPSTEATIQTEAIAAPAAEVTDAKDVAAESSPADEGAKGPKSTLEAVNAALEAMKIPKVEATTEAKSPNAEGVSAETEAVTEPEKEGEEPPFHKHPRWQEMVKERNALKEEVTTFRQFKQSVSEAGLEAGEIDTGFDIMRLMKSDPLAAYEKLKPFMDTLEAFRGNKLPDDLQAKVDAGQVDLETAQELVRVKSQSDFAQQRAANEAVQRQRSDEQREQEAFRSHLDLCGQAVTKLEREWQANDPDYAKKAKLIERTLTALNVERGVPRSVEDAVARAKEARDEINKTFVPLTRRTQEIRPLGGGSSATQATPVPKTLLEVTRMVAAGGKYRP